MGIKDGDRLNVDDGTAYTVDSGETEEWSGANIDGTLQVDGTLELIDDPQTPADPYSDHEQPLELPLSPLNLSDMNVGVAIFLVGVLATLGAIASLLKNYAAVVMLMLAVIALLASGLLGIGLELFWALTIATVLLIAAGMVVRWSQ